MMARWSCGSLWSCAKGGWLTESIGDSPLKLGAQTARVGGALFAVCAKGADFDFSSFVDSSHRLFVLRDPISALVQAHRPSRRCQSVPALPSRNATSCSTANPSDATPARAP